MQRRCLAAYVQCRRLLCCAAAFFVLYVEVTGSMATRQVLLGASMDLMPSLNYESPLILPFLLAFLANQTHWQPSQTPGLSFVYLDTAVDERLVLDSSGCLAPTPDDAMLRPPFLTLLLHNLLDNQRAWHAINLSHYTVLVDCAFDGRRVHDTTALKVHLLDPGRVNVTTIVLQTMTLDRPQKHILSACGVASVATTSLSALAPSPSPSPQKPSYRLLVGIEFPYILAPFQLFTVRDPSPSNGRWTGTLSPTREDVVVYGSVGLYRGALRTQGNYGLFHWALVDDPRASISTLAYWISPFCVDSYAWVRCLLGMGVSVNLFLNIFVSIVIVCNRWRHDHVLWVPDLYPSIQRRIQLRAILLLGATIFNQFWHVFEFCLQHSNARLGLNYGFVLDAMVRSDGLTYILSFALTLCDVLRARVCLDVLVGIYTCCWVFRTELLSACGWMLRETDDFVFSNYLKDIVPNPNGVMALWAAHENARSPLCLFVTELTWFYVALLLTAVYTLVAKRLEPARDGPRRAQVVPYLSREHIPQRLRSEILHLAQSERQLFAKAQGIVAPTPCTTGTEERAVIPASSIWLLGYLVVRDTIVIEIADYPWLCINLILHRRYFCVYGFHVVDGAYTNTEKTLVDLYDLRLWDVVWRLSLRPLALRLRAE
ncbi:hypothetical protein SPRG_06547 [Saprolegnia parasitica CBS 223.65]|uniref:Uncharacterized protein n=1 Tax=Saprolegnia parasitica (strain CBS 223.65) TaxID=695850 RepID=A0A067CE09_SAPPC|nr:hypothetical protein SPRG_06547 [Saprolegnia parasitica CBS 223.65]KDO28693.1 hypothetical protein SPRG_06547 [Saprolegnia parasitica CBS 223.65]|eukprot:XP_012200751.1 hypothetical protein SPRG_06547 [Saprolegnia parasitica CBS 223.65]